MTASDFRRIALSFVGAEDGSHMGATDFRVGGRIFATLASVKEGYGNLMLTLQHQAAFIAERPDLFLPIHGGWGRMGMTHIRLAPADEDTLTGGTAHLLEAARGEEPQDRQEKQRLAKAQAIRLAQTLTASLYLNLYLCS